jgi:hypothetical protein
VRVGKPISYAAARGDVFGNPCPTHPLHPSVSEARSPARHGALSSRVSLFLPEYKMTTCATVPHPLR